MIQLELYNESGLDVPVSLKRFKELAALVSKGEIRSFDWIELVYVDEQGIVEINNRFLDRNYVTDVITFSYSDEHDGQNDTGIEGTIYMCNQRIREQAIEFESDMTQEFERIFVHGLLHLCGHDDVTPELKQKMTALENSYLIGH